MDGAAKGYAVFAFIHITAVYFTQISVVLGLFCLMRIDYTHHPLTDVPVPLIFQVYRKSNHFI